MAWRYHGKASVSPSSPRAFAVCDRCGNWTNHYKLSSQAEWTGQRLADLNLLVCDKCLDTPQEQLRARVLPPDPVPIINPRPENFGNAENTYLSTNGGDTLITGDGLNLVVN